MSSIIGQMGNIGQVNYATAKAGIVGFTNSREATSPGSSSTSTAACTC